MRQVLLVTLLLITTPVWAAEWFISTSGSDSNPCTQASPCATLDRATDVGGPGDTFYFRAGTYGERDL
jgi:hypothetical protein